MSLESAMHAFQKCWLCNLRNRSWVVLAWLLFRLCMDEVRSASDAEPRRRSKTQPHHGTDRFSSFSLAIFVFSSNICTQCAPYASAYRCSHVYHQFNMPHGSPTSCTHDATVFAISRVRVPQSSLRRPSRGRCAVVAWRREPDKHRRHWDIDRFTAEPLPILE